MVCLTLRCVMFPWEMYQLSRWLLLQWQPLWLQSTMMLYSSDHIQTSGDKIFSHLTSDIFNEPLKTSSFTNSSISIIEWKVFGFEFQNHDKKEHFELDHYERHIPFPNVPSVNLGYNLQFLSPSGSQVTGDYNPQTCFCCLYSLPC